MDQLRKAWGWLQRHHFWVLIVVVCAMALGCWWRGASALYAEFITNKQKIESEFSAQSTLRNQPFHPNEAVQEKQSEQIATQQQSVNSLWRQLYERQTAEVLKWPKNLSDGFRNYIEKLKFGENIPRDLRDHYNNYVKDHFPELPKIVGALAMTEGDANAYRGGYGGRGGYEGGRMEGRGGYAEETMRGVGPGQAEEEDYIVRWLDQQLVYSELYVPSTPSAKRIWKTQEDLWVYEALLRIIARTNEVAGADRYSNAAVREIESLEVGRPAAQASRARGRIEIVAVPGAVGEYGEGTDPRMMGEGAVPPAEGGGEMYGREGSMGGYGSEYGAYEGRGEMGGDSALSDAALFSQRYLGPDGTPIAATGDEGPDAFGKEFKRLPVRMRLWMDQRWLPQLITECANAPLQVEVKEVRINPSESGGEGGMRGGYGGRGGEGGYGGYAGLAGEEMMPEQDPNLKTVVIQGTVYIFNPPTEEAAPVQVAEVP
jgi:hypothetical protein